MMFANKPIISPVSITLETFEEALEFYNLMREIDKMAGPKGSRLLCAADMTENQKCIVSKIVSTIRDDLPNPPEREPIIPNCK